MGELLVVTGPPGAGKSTVARLLSAAFERSVLITGDSFFAFLDRGAVAPWLPGSGEQNDVVTEAAAAATGRFAGGEYHVVYEGVIGPWYLSTFLQATGLPELHYAILLPDEQTCVQRVRDRSEHGFTDLPATRHMHRQFVAAAVDPRHVLAPPPDDPQATAAVIRRRLDAGELLVRK